MKKYISAVLVGLSFLSLIGCGGSGGSQGPTPVDQEVEVGPNAPCYFSAMSDLDLKYTIQKAGKVLPSVAGTSADSDLTNESIVSATFVMSAFAVSVSENVIYKIVASGQLPIAIKWATDRYHNSFLEPTPEIIENIKTCKGK